ncbi:hypothetical protein [Pectobacterium versatile]|uniref:hypothetical protein n=1 Tax=Pectobacterium versatile TaxID=2488639 RepID=UPI002B24960E|nr:hypothetical protein [Pectobacterium versatile]
MQSYFYDFEDEDDEVRQGDIIRKNINSIQEKEDSHQFGLIITADCDIAQNKSSYRYNWLEIVTAQDFLAHHWLKSTFQKINKKQTEQCLLFLNKNIQSRNENLSILSSSSLYDWLRTDTPEEIFHSLDVNENREIINKLKVLYIIHHGVNEDNPLSSYKEIHSLLGGNEKGFKKELIQALEGTGGFPDFFFLPEIPRCNNNIGYVVLLRNIYSMDYEGLHFSEVNARVNGDPNGFYRIGRLNESIKYSISQKLAFLFSRIGMETDFEDNCSAAIELSIEDITTLKELTK